MEWLTLKLSSTPLFPSILTSRCPSNICATRRARFALPFPIGCSSFDEQRASPSLHRPAGCGGIDLRTTQVSRRAAISNLVAIIAGASGGVVRLVAQTPIACAAEQKQTNLSVEQVKEIIEDDIRKGQYYVTGNLSPSIYNDNCKFTDPTTVVTGVNKYVAAVKLLFDPELSQQELLSIDVVGPRTIEANWRLGGYLKFPWKPHIMPYEGFTRYTLGDDGLVAAHDETWSISLLTALLELFTPSWGPH